jgi:hypothetical protein
VSYDNHPFNSDLFDEYVACNVLFADAIQRSAEPRCFQVPGLLILDVHVRPSIGSTRMLELAGYASLLLVTAIIRPVMPNAAPPVNMRTPSVYKDLQEKSGWVRAQVSCPFYYDLEI